MTMKHVHFLADMVDNDYYLTTTTIIKVCSQLTIKWMSTSSTFQTLNFYVHSSFQPTFWVLSNSTILNNKWGDLVNNKWGDLAGRNKVGSKQDLLCYIFFPRANKLSTLLYAKQEYLLVTCVWNQWSYNQHLDD